MIEPEPCSTILGIAYLQPRIDAADVDGHDLVPGRDVGVDDRVVGRGHDPGVVVEGVDAAEGRHRVVDHPLRLVLLRHVGGDGGRLAAGRGHLGRRRLGHLLRHVDADDLRALRGEHRARPCAPCRRRRR